MRQLLDSRLTRQHYIHDKKTPWVITQRALSDRIFNHVFHNLYVLDRSQVFLQVRERLKEDK
jgi:hypothetical protein